jgi:putative salt-induced outer membrane protein YdiY
MFVKQRLRVTIGFLVGCGFVWISCEVASGQPLLGPPSTVVLPSASAPAANGSPAVSQSLAAPPASALTPASEVLPLPGSVTTEATIGAPSASTMDQILNAEIPAEPPRVKVFRYMPWETSIEFGLNGSSGTSDSLSIRAGGHILRESRFSKLDLDTTYNRTSNGGVPTQDNAELDIRNDWLLDEASPWTLFATSNLFYDQFQAFDLQTSANTGIGYRFVHLPELELIGRVGGGVSREIGGPDDRTVPEALLGSEYTQRISTKQKATAKLDYYPDLDEVGEFRLVAEAGWEIALDRPSNVCLKLAANDRYDSTPSGANPHLVNYSVLLLIKL